MIAFATLQRARDAAAKLLRRSLTGNDAEDFACALLAYLDDNPNVVQVAYMQEMLDDAIAERDAALTELVRERVAIDAVKVHVANVNDRLKIERDSALAEAATLRAELSLMLGLDMTASKDDLVRAMWRVLDATRSPVVEQYAATWLPCWAGVKLDNGTRNVWLKGARLLNGSVRLSAEVPLASTGIQSIHVLPAQCVEIWQLPQSGDDVVFYHSRRGFVRGVARIAPDGGCAVDTEHGPFYLAWKDCLTAQLFDVSAKEEP